MQSAGNTYENGQRLTNAATSSTLRSFEALYSSSSLQSTLSIIKQKAPTRSVIEGPSRIDMVRAMNISMSAKRNKSSIKAWRSVDVVLL